MCSELMFSVSSSTLWRLQVPFIATPNVELGLYSVYTLNKVTIEVCLNDYALKKTCAVDYLYAKVIFFLGLVLYWT